MKKIAFFILFLFMVVQILPAIQSIWDNGQAIVMDISEEKKAEKDDSKSINEFLSFYSINNDLSVKLLTQIQLDESIMTSLCFEKLYPPPDFC